MNKNKEKQGENFKLKFKIFKILQLRQLPNLRYEGLGI